MLLKCRFVSSNYYYRHQDLLEVLSYSSMLWFCLPVSHAAAMDVLCGWTVCRVEPKLAEKMRTAHFARRVLLRANVGGAPPPSKRSSALSS